MPANPPTVLTQDDPSVPQALSQAQWGLYLGGQPAITADVVVSLGVNANSVIATFPVLSSSSDTGSTFESYDKVQTPFIGHVRFATGGSVADRIALINSIDAAKQALTQYDLCMPEKIYFNVVVADYQFDRSAVKGVGLFAVDVTCEEVRDGASASFSTSPGQSPITNAKNPGANDPVNGGTVQATPAPIGIQQGVSAAIDGGGGW